MPKKQSNAPKGSSRKVGNRKTHCDRYKAKNSLMKNKIKRISKSNGLKAVEVYRRDKTKQFPKEK